MAEPPPSMSTSLQLNNIPEGGYKVTITAADGTTIFHQAVEHPSQITLNISGTHPFPGQNAIPATTFPKFDQLPPEIRFKIWHFSLDHPRIFWPNLDRGDTEKLQGVNFAHKPPPVRQVCREARHISDRRGRFSFGTCGSRLTSLWFDFHSDILFDKEPLALEEPGLTDYVRNVALWHYDARELKKAGEFKRLMKTYPKCQKIIFVWSGVTMNPYGDVKFYPIHDDEPIESSLFRSDEEWGGLKTLINRAWREKNFLKRCRLTENQLPIIEAAECTFVKKDPDARRTEV